MATSVSATNCQVNTITTHYDARTKVAKFLIDQGMEVELKRPYEAPDDWLEKSFEAIGEPVPDSLRESSD